MAYGMMSEEERKRALMAQMLQQGIVERERKTTNRGLNRHPTQNEVLGLPDTDYSMNASMVGPDANNILERENNLLQYHQNSINNNMIFDETGAPTTVYTAGLVNPEQPDRLYTVPGYDNVTGKYIAKLDEFGQPLRNERGDVIIDEDKLYDTAKERNYFDTMPYTKRYPDNRDLTVEEHMELVRRLKNVINRDGTMIQKIRGTYGRN